MEKRQDTIGRRDAEPVKTAYSEYQAALKKEQSLQYTFNTQKQESIQLNSNAISYNTLRNEVHKQ